MVDGWQELVELSDEELVSVDIAELNLICAKGLPGAEGLDIAACMERLDEWTECVRLSTERAFDNLPYLPEYQDWSEPRYRMLSLMMTMHNRLGLTYNVDFNAGPFDGRDSRNLFIHAVLMDGYPACCTNAPIICASLSRRMGYPVRIVQGKEHLFCRWDDPNGDIFNIETTSYGLYTHPDTFYYDWPKPIDMMRVWDGTLMRSLTPREEAALCVSQRGLCLAENLSFAEVLEADFFACKLAPNDPFLRHRMMSNWLIDRGINLSRSKSNGNCTPDDIRIPEPRHDWEHKMYPWACKSLKRIVSNHKKDLLAFEILA